MKLFRNLAFALFLAPCTLMAQNLSLQPKAVYCSGTDGYIPFSTFGQFPEDEDFALIQVLYSGDQVQLGVSKGDSVKFTPTGSISAKLKGLKSGVESPTIYINIKPLPSAFLKYESEPVCEGFSRAVEIYTGLEPGDQISWFVDDSLLENGNKAILQATKTGLYTARLTRAGCTAKVGGQAKITIGQINAPLVNSINTPQICEGFDVQLIAQNPSISNVSLKWMLDNDTLSHTTNSIQVSESGDYRAIATQGSCQSISNPFSVKVGKLKAGEPLSSPVKAENGLLEICQSATVTLQASGYTNRNDVSTLWYKNDSLINPGSFSTIFISEPGTYRYTQKQGDCISYSKPIEVAYGNFEVLDLISPTLPQTCEGKTLNLQISSKNSSLVRDIYKLELWRNEEKIQDIGQFFETLKITQSGEYMVKGQLGSSGCQVYSGPENIEFAKNEVHFNLSQGALAAYSCEDSVLLGNTFNLSTGGPASYEWLKEGETVAKSKVFYARESGKYQLKVKADSACSFVSNELEVKLGSIYARVINSGSRFCSGELNQLTVVAGSDENLVLGAGGAPVSSEQLHVNWLLNNQNFKSGLSTSVYQSGTYKAEVSLEACKTITEDYPLTLKSVEVSLSPEDPELSICPGGGKVRLSSNAESAVHYWFKDDMPIAAFGQDFIAEETGTYSVWVEEDGCFAMSRKVNIKEDNSLPEAVISGDKSITYGQAAFVQIDFKGSGPWSFSLPEGGTFETLTNPYIFEVSPTTTTTYTITTVSNPCGFGMASGEATVSVIILGTANEEDKLVSVYPNPTFDRIKVKGTESFQYQLRNIQGRSLLQGNIDFDREIDLQKLPAGLYLLVLQNENGRLVRKVIKQ